MRGSQLVSRAFGSLLLLGSLLLTNVVTHQAGAMTQEPQATANQAPALQTMSPAPKRLLVIVPHPDDASLGGTAMIQRTLRTGGQVQLVVMTSGDGFRLAASRTFSVVRPGPRDLFQLGLVRQQEELASARQLGLRPQDVVFLGYPDSGLHQLWSSSHWRSNKPFQAPNGFDHVPYPLAFHQGAPYCGQSVVNDLQELVDRFQPTDVLFPDPHDIHNDHWATNAFTQSVLNALPQPPQTWTYLIHYPNFPVPRYYRPQGSLTPPPDIAALPGLAWYTLPLGEDLHAIKQRAIQSHQSQVSVMGDLLFSFLRTNDLISHYTPPIVQDDTDHAVIQDPAWDDAKNQHVSAADLRRVSIMRSGGRLYITAEYAGNVRPNLDYCFRLRIPEALEFHVQGGELRNHSLTSHSAAPSVSVAGRRLTLSLPDTPFAKANRLLFSTDVSQNRQTLDKTAWYTFQLHSRHAP